MKDQERILKMPNAEPNGFVKTLNNMGYMTSTLDPFSQAFVDFSSKSSCPVLDIGAAYGVATLKALAKGASVIANDIDQRHLDILWERAPKSQRSRLQLKPGSFPHELHFTSNSIRAVLIARVFHFFSGPLIEESIAKIHEWLIPEGKLFIIAETPYLKSLQKFIPLYEERKREGNLWPGFIKDIAAFAPDRAKNLPLQMNMLDPEILVRVLTKAGFKVEKAHTFARPDFPVDLQLDGRESVGVIARKI